MTPSTVESKNQSGTPYTISFDPKNIEETSRNLLFRLPVTMLEREAKFVIVSSRAAYPTNEEFIESVEKAGVQELKILLDSSTDEGFKCPTLNLANAWTVVLEDQI